MALNKHVVKQIHWKVGDVAKIIKRPRETIYYYEKMFPFVTCVRRDEGIRKYNRKEVNTIIMVNYLITKVGMTLKGVKQAHELKYGKEIIQLTYSKIEGQELILI